MANIIELTDFDKECLNEFMVTSLCISFHTDPLSAIVFPTLPYNFRMLMSDLDWPEKAMGNPNGTLFMHPGEIDDSPADDLGLQCFGNFNKPEFITMTYGKKANANVGDGDDVKKGIRKAAKAHSVPAPVTDSLQFIPAAGLPVERLNSVYRYLVEASYNMVGFDIGVQDIKARNTAYSTLATDVSKEISTYIARSLSIINPVVQLVSGQGAREAINKVRKVISSANQAGIDSINVWITNFDAIEKEKDNKEASFNLKSLENKTKLRKQAQWFINCYLASPMPRTTLSKSEVIQRLSNDANEIDTPNKLDEFIGKWMTGSASTYSAFKSLMRNKEFITAPIPAALRVNESMADERGQLLTEDVGNPEGRSNAVDYDNIYEKVYGVISDTMSDIIGPRAEWVCMKSLEESMKNLKDRADAEITKKIEIICKTNGQKSMVHWPFKAEGLLTMWNRYSSELQTRINNRIGQLTGSAGGRETGSANMVEDFLRNTYPRIIAAMLTYKLLFEQLSYEYKKGVVMDVTAENAPVIINEMTEVKLLDMITLLRMFDDLTI